MPPKIFWNFRFFMTLMLVMIGVSGQRAQGTTSQKADPISRQEPLQLKFIANEGVLVSSGDKKILIDALFDKPNKEYRAPSRDALEKMITGAAPFDGVDLLLVTHNHPDHFDALLAVRYMETFSGSILLAPADAVAEIRICRCIQGEMRIRSLRIVHRGQDIRGKNHQRSH